MLRPGGAVAGPVFYAATGRVGALTSASPSITTVSPTEQTVCSTTRPRSGITYCTVTRASTMSPMRTGALNARLWLR